MSSHGFLSCSWGPTSRTRSSNRRRRPRPSMGGGRWPRTSTKSTAPTTMRPHWRRSLWASLGSPRSSISTGIPWILNSLTQMVPNTVTVSKRRSGSSTKRAPFASKSMDTTSIIHIHIYIHIPNRTTTILKVLKLSQTILNYEALKGSCSLGP